MLERVNGFLLKIIAIPPSTGDQTLVSLGCGNLRVVKGDAMEDDNKLSFFFLGLGLGVAVGVLFAPKSGSETRELLKSKAGEGADYVKRRGAELKETAEEAIDRGKQTLQRHKENLSAAVEAGKQAYRESVTAPAD
jgi:gas vesicle protein